MGFFKKIFKIAKSVAPLAIGVATGNPALAAAVGAGLGATSGGGIKGAVLGGLGGYASGVAGAGIGNAYNAAGGNIGKMVGTAASNIGKSVTGFADGLKSFATNPLTSLSNTFQGATGAGTVAKGASDALTGGNPLLSLLNTGGSLYSAVAGSDAATQAANAQIKSAREALSAQERALTQIRGDLQPFVQAGVTTAPQLTNLVNDPQAQLNFIQSNPFYQSLAEDAKNKIFANEAARGKLGSGGTAQALQNSLLLLGNDLLNQDIQRKQNLTNMGQNAAAQTGTFTQGSTNNLIDLTTDIGTNRASGIMGGYNARTGAINNFLGGQTALYGIDRGVRI